MTFHAQRVVLRSSFVLTIALAATLSTGCAKTGKVSGKVTLPDGTPLPGGRISFVPEDPKKNPASGIIAEDGTYSVDVPVGNCKVSIDNRSAGKAFSPVGAGGVSGPPKEGNTALAGGKGMGPMMPTPKGGKGPPGGIMTGPPTGVGQNKPGIGPSESAFKGGNEGIEGAMAKAGADKASDQIPVPGKAVPINEKYLSGETSGLSLEVKGGSQTFDIKLDK